MPRPGLTTDRVVELAAELADEVGLDHLTLAAVAQRGGVAAPSLYSHVDGLADLRARIATLARAELADRLGAAVAGRSGRDALAAFAAAYRAYGRAHPGRMAAVEEPPAPAADDGGDGARIVAATYATFRSYGLVEPDLTDAVRLVRSTLHGFTDLERRAHFHDPAPVDATFDRLVDALDAALTHWPARREAPAVTVTRHRLPVAGVSLAYEVRGTGPLVLLVGGPATTVAYAGLADALAVDHTVVAYDPRGFGRSPREDDGDLSADVLAADAAALLEALDAGPAWVVGCSGGAVTGLALRASRPELVAGLVAHEPPLVRVLPDADDRLAEAREVRATFRRDGAPAAMARLTRLTSGVDPLAADDAGSPALDPAGGREPEPATGETDGDVARFLADLLVPVLHTEPPPTDGPPLTVGLGVDSAGELAHRCAVALAERHGVAPLTFPGDHLGATTHPAAFAAVLRTVLPSEEGS